MIGSSWQKQCSRIIVWRHQCVYERCFMPLRYACCLQQPPFGRRLRRLRQQKPAAAQKAASAQRAASAAHPQLELLRKVSGLSGVSIVEGTVKRFSQDFEAGARNPDRFLSEVRLSQPALVSEWQNTPREKRIFVIGAGKDSAKVSELAESLKSDGYKLFFTSFVVKAAEHYAHPKPLEHFLVRPTVPCYITLHPPSSANTSRLRSRQRGS